MGSASALTDFFDPGELSAEELLDWVDLTAREQPEFARRFLSRVEALGGPVELLDFSVGSLRPAWVWHVANARIERGEKPTDPSGLAVWMRGYPGMVAARGYDYSWMGTELAAYFSEVLRRRTQIRFVIQERNRLPVLQGPTGVETLPGPFPLGFVARIKPAAAANKLHLVRRALEMAGGHGGIPEPLFDVEKFVDEVVVGFPDDVAHRYGEVVEKAQEQILALGGVELLDGDREQLIFRETEPNTDQLALRIRTVLRQLDDPRFPGP